MINGQNWGYDNPHTSGVLGEIFLSLTAIGIEHYILTSSLSTKIRPLNKTRLKNHISLVFDIHFSVFALFKRQLPLFQKHRR